jgi:hypothetical protein
LYYLIIRKHFTFLQSKVELNLLDV